MPAALLLVTLGVGEPGIAEADRRPRHISTSVLALPASTVQKTPTPAHADMTRAGGGGVVYFRTLCKTETDRHVEVNAELSTGQGRVDSLETFVVSSGAEVVLSAGEEKGLSDNCGA